jgi:PAS domain S-box-containing protein
MDLVWRSSPMGALRVWSGQGGLRVEPNAAAWLLAPAHGLTDADWLQLAASCLQAADDDVELPVPAKSARACVLACRRIALPDGALIWIAPAAANAAAYDDGRQLLIDQLDLALDFGRMGLFERDLVTGAGRWDRHVHRIYGLDAERGTPDIAEVMRQCVHADDRAALQAHFQGSQTTQGRGSARFRITRPDGEVRHIHSIYELRRGPDGRATRAVGVLIDDTDSMQRLAAQQRANEVLERALQLAGVSVWRIDLSARRIHFNAIGFLAVGMPPAEDGMSLEAMRDTIHPDDRQAVLRAADEAVASGRVVDLVARYRNGDGSWRTLLTRRVADRDDRGEAVALAGISIDIGAQVAASERAEAMAARARLVVEAIGVGFWSRDNETGAAYWDESMHRIHRRSPQLGPPALDGWIPACVHPHDQRWMTELQARDTANWEPITDATFRLHDAEDGERWVQSWTRRVWRDGRRLSFGMHLDVTERQRSQTLQQRERERQQYAINAARIGVWERAADGSISYWNDAMYRLRDLDPADRRSCEELLALTSHPDDHAVMLAATAEQLREGEPFRLEYRVRRADGGWRWIATQGHTLRDAEGRAVGVAGVNFDITERKRADALQLEKQRAEQASRDKSAFMARMSHELRTPMNAVLGFTQLLEDDAAERPTERQRARLQRIRQAGSQLMVLIEDVLDLARLETEAPMPPGAPLALAQVLREVAGSVSALATRHGQRLLLGELPAETVVHVEGHRLGHALSQLAAHAIRERDRPGGLEISVVLAPAGGSAQLIFSVHSEGSPPAADAPLFASPAPELRAGEPDGSGIGLGLARSAIEAMGGNVEFDAAGGGFTVRLQVSCRQPGGAPRAMMVLCVEDNPVNMLLVSELLSLRPGVRLVGAVDGRSAIALALAERPDVVLLDLQLPDISGLEVLRHLRAEPVLGRSTFIALSANAMPVDIAAARAAGFDDYWTKPIDFNRFLAGIDRLAADLAARLAADVEANDPKPDIPRA